MSTPTKEEVEKAKAAQEELNHRILTRTHVPNPVPELGEVEKVEATTKKLKVEKVFVNHTLEVKDAGKSHNVSIPINREHPAVGDTVEVVFTKSGENLTVNLAKPPKVVEPLKK